MRIFAFFLGKNKKKVAGVAAMLLTTESLVTEIPEPPSGGPATPDMGGMGMY